ncbi:hypothetical protein AMTR_s00002p00120440 [Amborella trichopoda]|uniref:DUF4283 domain-containing protein n=1 Tax=Amborella trichopoda TaxID=13333 RepID=W1NZA9_AMBTC|nr:hypothetical protein AMTR_s00002p00120440 [Amborella trichopoda]
MGAAKPLKIWLKVAHNPLQAWNIDTFKKIRNALGSFIVVHWRSASSLPLGTIQLLLQTPFPFLPPFLWQEVNGLFFRTVISWSLGSPTLPSRHSQDHAFSFAGPLSQDHINSDSMLHSGWTTVSRKNPSRNNHCHWSRHRRAKQGPQTHPKPKSRNMDRTAQLGPLKLACVNIQASSPQPRVHAPDGHSGMRCPSQLPRAHVSSSLAAYPGTTRASLEPTGRLPHQATDFALQLVPSSCDVALTHPVSSPSSCNLRPSRGNEVLCACSNVYLPKSDVTSLAYPKNGMPDNLQMAL